MSASQRIIRQNDGLDTLKELLELVKDPAAIQQAHAAARAETVLTEAQAAHFEAAKKTIAEAGAIEADLEKKRGQLDAQINQHNSNVAEKDSEFKKQKDNLEAREEAVKAQEKTQDEREKANTASLVKLEKERKEMLADFKQKLTEIEKREDAVNKDKDKNEKEGDRLISVRQGLEKKSKALQAVFNG